MIRMLMNHSESWVSYYLLMEKTGLELLGRLEVYVPAMNSPVETGAARAEVRCTVAANMSDGCVCMYVSCCLQ